MTINHWELKLAAWTHDPAEKALILMRDPAGHEGGTVKALQKELFSSGLSSKTNALIKKADHWSAAADRPNFPSETYTDKSGAEKLSDRWSSVRFYNSPELKHPLSGETYDLHSLQDGIGVDAIKAVSLDHFRELIQRDGEDINHQKTALAFWRFGPHLSAHIPNIWQLLPADTRIPDHTIWSHLDLTAAFASAMAQDADENPALLSMSFGPVQDFIAQARSTSDLWAGSHLLSRMVWEGLKVICEAQGPDAVIFPQLRGVALVDAWLYQDMGLLKELFEKTNQKEWLEKNNDTNPLFAAALPNKFMALVPASQAKELAEKVTERVRHWVQHEAKGMLDQLLKTAGIEYSADFYCYQQLRDQLADFPEVHWASVSWELVARDENGKADNQQVQLKEVVSSLIPEGKSFIESDLWSLLNKDIELDGAGFYTPNPGVLYPVLVDLLDRTLAAAKTLRPFKQLKQKGYRCTLTGEHEWLTTDKTQLINTPKNREDTLWTKVEGQLGIKKGEHLGAIAMFKRLWPRQFSQWVRELIGEDINRFVISTHTLAIASKLKNIGQLPDHIKAQAEKFDGVTLPRKLFNNTSENRHLVKKIPALLDSYREQGDTAAREELERELKNISGSKPETYYALLYMDGDKMGAWLADSWSSEEGNNNRLTFESTWHSKVKSGLNNKFYDQKDFLAYTKQFRPISPARHMAISGALNSFALNIARHVVEECYMGKLLYAGGDDVMAMVAVKDLLPCMLTLRLAYSGVYPERPTNATENLFNLDKMLIGRGHVLLKKQLHRVMGNKATASIGAVVAHHTAPLAYVLRQLRGAEKDAKSAGRDAFAFRIIKRGGGAEHLQLSWLAENQYWNNIPELESTRMGLLIQLRDQLAAKEGLSRRVAYIVNTWLPQLPDAEDDNDKAFVTMVEILLLYQLKQQGGKEFTGENGKARASLFAKQLLDLAGRNNATQLKKNLRGIFATAEFFAREGRGGGQTQ